MKNKTLSGLFMVGALALSSVPVAGGVLAYGTSSDWLNAGSQVGIVTFEGVTIPPSFSTFTLPPLTFSSTLGNFLMINTNGFGPGTGNYLLNASPTNITSDGTVYGLGFNFRCYSCDGQTATITVTDSNGDTVYSIPTTSVGISNYFGVRDTLSIQNLQVSFGGVTPWVAMDNVAFDGAATPEPATLVMIGTGLALLARLRRHIVVPCLA